MIVMLVMVIGLATALDPSTAQAEQPPAAAEVGPAEAEDIPSARATARLQDRRIEALSERTETTTTWVNPDGTRTTEFNGGPVRVRQNDAWVPVNLTLQRYDDGSVRPTAHPRDLVIAGAGGEAGTPQDLASVQAPEGRVALQYPGALPEPVLEGTSVLYPEVQPGVDLRVTATRTGFEQFFVVKQRPTTPLDLTLPVRAEGLTTRTDGDGNTDLVSPAGAVVGSVPAATMWDARTDPASGDPLQVVRVPGAVAAVAPLAREGLAPLNGVDVDVEVDLGYFADPALVYPVTVDPGVTIHTNFDTFTQTGVTTDQSGSTELRIGSPDNGTTKARSYLHFDVSALTGHQILSADLRLSARFSPSCEPRNWEVWDTALVSTSTRWSNQPAPYTRWATSGTTLGNPPACPDGPTSTNVQSLIQSWANRSVTTGSLLLKAEDESDSLGYKKFSSAQGASTPHLVVTYNRIPDVAASLDITDRGDHQGTVFTRSLTPTLSFTPRDPDGDVVSVVFYVYDGNNMIHDQWVDNIASGSVARWQVPPGMLADGREYRFRVTTMDATRAFADDAWVRLRSVQTGQVADVAGCGITNGTPVMQAPNNSTDCQRWFPWGTGDGFHHFRVRHSGQVLDNSQCGTGEGNPVATFDQAGGDCQKWAIERFGNGEYKFAVKNADKVLDQGCTTGNVQLTVKNRRSDGCQTWAMDLAPNNGATVRWLTVSTDTTLPGAPYVTSTDYPSDQNWYRGSGQAGSFRFANAANQSPPVAYVYGLDSTPTTEVTPGTGASGTNDAVVSINPTTDGRHVLNVRTKDRAGNLSGVTSYAFNVGRAGLLRPGDGERTPARLPISISGQPAMDNVKFFWRRGPGTTAYAAIPVAHLRRADGSVLPNVSAQGFVATAAITGGLYWAANETLGSAAGSIEIRAEFSEVREGTSPYTTPWRAVVVDPNADGAASTDIAGGELNLLTGDFTQHTTDVQEFGLSVSRSTSSRDPRAGYQSQRERLTPNQQQLITDTAGFTSVMADVARSTSGGYESTEALRVTPKASGSMGADTFSSIEGDGGAMRLGMRPGRIYRVTGWIYVPGATGLNPTDVDGLKIVAFTGGGTTGSRRYASNMPTAMDTWQELRVDIAVPADATSGYVRLYNGFSVGTGKQVFYDNLSVRELHAPFGPQWKGGTSVDADGIDYNRLTIAGSVVRLEAVDGRGIWFTKGNGGAYFPEPGAEHLRLALSGSTYTLNEIDGTVTTFTQTTPGGAWTVASTTPPTVQAQTRYIYEDVDDQSRIRRVIAPPEVGVGDCATPTPARGCEVLEYEYASTRTASPTALGDIVGQVSRIWAWTTNPANGAVERVEIVRYVYDDAGRLREVWDPRLTQPIKTTYAYDADGRVIEMNGSGDLPWYFDHGTVGVGDPNAGRLLRVRRAALRPGTLDVLDGEIATTVVYNVPLTRAAGGPHDLDGAAVAQWSQRSIPTDATALFGPEDPVAANTANGTAPGADGYRAATVHYLDPAGREINTATPGGYIDTSEFDRFGNVIRSLDSTNRELALGRLPGGDALLSQLGLAQYDPPTRATWLDDRSTYSGDGIDLLTSTSELQRLALDGDPTQLVNARAETSTTYDEGKPDGFAYHLPTTTRSGARVVGITELRDVQVTRTGYGPELGGLPGWALRIATSTTLDAEGPTGSAVTMRTRLDDRGRARESRRIDANGTDAGTTIAVFYTAGNNPDDASCGNRPEWAGNACVTRPGGDVTGHDSARMPTALPTKRVTSYTRFGEADRIVETAAGQERTTMTTFDGADRVTAVEITGLGVDIPRTTTTYDPVTGDATATRFPDGTQVTREFDRLGRLRSYTDADGAWTRTEFDRFGKPSRIDDSLGTNQTFAYDRAAEPRGLLTSVTDSVGGTMTARYGPDGQLLEQGLPGGVRLAITLDPAGKATARTYTRASDSVLIAASSEVENVRGQTISTSGPGSNSVFGYDRYGRLTSARQTASATGICTVRAYTYDRRSNRTGRTSRTGTAPGSCPADGPAETTAHTYDSADRQQDGGYTYDTFGRITTTPGGVTNSFYDNDLLAAQQTADQRMTWTLDPTHRQHRYVSERLVNGQWANAVTKVHHYGADGDEPRWTAEDVTNPNDLTRYLEAPGDGAMAVTTARTGGAVLQLSNLHGDIMGTLSVNPAAGTITGALTVLDSDEFGRPTTTTASDARYGWLGAAQRSGDALGDVILMGVRIYHPDTGRFWQPDPEPGGGATPYDYCYADPVNCTDLDGRAGFWSSLVSTVAKVAEVASWIPGPIGAAAGGISAVAYASQGNWRKAGEMALTAAANLIGAGAAVRAGMRVISAAGRVTPRAAATVRRSARASTRSRCHSFLPSTGVLMADGTALPISQIRVGDIVLSGNPVTGEVAVSPVVDVITGDGESDLTQLHVEGANKPIIATSHHPFWVDGQGWTAVERIREGDDIVTGGGQMARVEAVVPLGYRAGVVYNLTVDQLHTFFVALDSQRVLTHNCPAKRGDNELSANRLAQGPHTTFRRADTTRTDVGVGRVTNYSTWRPEARAPTGWMLTRRFRGAGRLHFNFRPPIIYPRGKKGYPARGGHRGVPKGYPRKRRR